MENCHIIIDFSLLDGRKTCFQHQSSNNHITILNFHQIQHKERTIRKCLFFFRIMKVHLISSHTRSLSSTNLPTMKNNFPIFPLLNYSHSLSLLIKYGEIMSIEKKSKMFANQQALHSAHAFNIE
jgi:hypothetical protein